MRIKDIIIKKSLKKNNFKIKKLDYLINKINSDLDLNKNTLHILSKKFDLGLKFKDLKRYKKFNNIALIGMGGSILGSEAIYSFLKNKIKKKLFFFDNIDKEKIDEFKKKNFLKKTLFLVISKSGSTIETLVNLHYLKILKKNAKNIIIMSEKNNSSLFRVSKKYNLKFVEHKKYIGGRYSVLSEVGMLPSFLMGLNLRNFRKNIRNYLKSNKKIILKKNCLVLANLLSDKKYKSIVFLNYLPKIEKFLSWYQQLFAESLGKKSKGILPIISNCPKDHHSLLQLYLDGPKDKIFYIFGLDKFKRAKIKSYNNNFYQKQDMERLKFAQKKATIKVLKEKNIPYREFSITNINEETIGELFSYFMLETILAGKLININPFDQPAVEQVKALTRKFL